MNRIHALVLLAVLCVPAGASPREILKASTAELQATPGNDALREKIIRLAKTITPAPPVPEEVARRMARGEAALEMAKDENAAGKAVLEFQAAANAAPWLAKPYHQLGAAQEKAGKAGDAIKSFRFYLLAAPNAKDAADVKKRLYKLEFIAEQAVEQAAAQAAARNAARNAEAAARAAEENRFLIVPGRSAGSLALGMPLSRAEEILGKPRSVIAFDDGDGGIYNFGSVTIVYDGPRTVYRVYVESPDYRTATGISVGSTFDSARREFGAPVKEMEIKEGETRRSCFSNGLETTTDVLRGIIVKIQVGYRCEKWAW